MINIGAKAKERVENTLGASDIVNGTPIFYKIKEEEMESALKEIYDEIGYKNIE